MRTHHPSVEPRGLAERLARIGCLAISVSLLACGGANGGDAVPPEADAAGDPVDEPDPCAEVVCPDGTVCLPEDVECHCGGVDGPVCGEGEVCRAESGLCYLESPDVDPVCTDGVSWISGVQVFTEATSAWQLDALGVEGTGINAVDLNNDGWTDLIVRRGGDRSDVFADDAEEEGERNQWLLLNTGEGTFEDFTEESGFLSTRFSYGGRIGRPGYVMAFADVDNDGDIDGYTGLSTANPAASLQETSEVMLNNGEAYFAFSESGAVRREGEVDVPAGAAFTDVDRDGYVDLWVPQYDYTPPGESGIVLLQDRLYLGDGQGGFVDGTAELGLETADWSDLELINEGLAHTRAWGATACDINGDGWPELMTPSYGRTPNHFWQAEATEDGGVHYLNRSVDSGYAYDDDFTWQDNQFALCYCREHPDAEGCAGLPAPRIRCDSDNWDHTLGRQPYQLGGNSGATVCADFDNDGDIDLFTGEIRHWWAGRGSDGSEVLVNTGEAEVRFERPGDPATGLAIDHRTVSWDEGHMRNVALDFDNDGWQDLYIGASDYPYNRGLLYHNVTARERPGDVPVYFEEVPPSLGIDHNRSHGVAVADFDRDGDVDVVVGHSHARCEPDLPNDCYETMQVRLFENVLGDGGNWLQLQLVGGEGSNRAAIGARVEVTAGEVHQVQEVVGGYGHFGAQNDLVLHYGLGTSCRAVVSVRWPNAELTTERAELVSGYRYRWEQGVGIEVLEYR